jgi:hypothetical protein
MPVVMVLPIFDFARQLCVAAESSFCARSEFYPSIPR